MIEMRFINVIRNANKCLSTVMMKQTGSTKGKIDPITDIVGMNY